MFSFLISSLSMYMFTINQNMKVPFSLTKGSSLDLYAIVPGMSVVFSSTYNLNVTVSTKYSNLVYQTQQFSNESNSIHKNLKSVNFGSFTGRIRVVALEDTNFVYETIRGDFDKNQSCVINEDNFTADQEMKAPLPPDNQQSDEEFHHHFPPRNQQPGNEDHHHFPPHNQQPGNEDHHHFPPHNQYPGNGNHQHFPPHHQNPGNNNHNQPYPPQQHQPGDRYQKPERGNGRGSYNYDMNNNINSDGFSYDNLFDNIFILVVSLGFIILGIALVISIIRACKKNHCCRYNGNNYNEVDDSSIPPIIQQVDNFEQYIPPHHHQHQNTQIHQQQQPVQQIPLNYPQLQPVQQITPVIIPQSQQPIYPNYYYQQPVIVQQPVRNVGVFQGQPKPQ